MVDKTTEDKGTAESWSERWCGQMLLPGCRPHCQPLPGRTGKDCGLPFEPLLLPKTLNGTRTPLQGVVTRKEKPECHRWGNWIPSRFQPPFESSQAPP